MIRLPKPENLAKLTPEQRKVFDSWQAEAEQADVLLQQMLSAIADNDANRMNQLTLQLNELMPINCEHGHSVYLECAECDEIEKILYPEAFDAQGHRILGFIESQFMGMFPTPTSNKKLLN